MNDIYIDRCLEIAQAGLGNVQPNPMVGCVIVYEEKIIGEGYHRQIGRAHAEVNAIDSVKNKALLKKSRLYVNLEPCAHFGKTPPCAELIAKLKIPEVIIGTIDPFAKVKGRGVEILKKAGCKVKTGVLEDKCKELNKRFFTYHEKNRPYVILKWAQTKDGFIDIVRSEKAEKKPTWITNETARIMVHKWRSEEQAIIVGKNTVNKDNPKLNVRNWEGKDPLRIVIDRNLQLSNKFNLFDQSQDTLVFNQLKQEADDKIEYVRIDFNNDVIKQVLNELYEKEIQSVIVEGGSYLIDSFIKANLWDEARVFTGDVIFQNGVSAPQLIAEPIHRKIIGNSNLEIFRNI